MKKALIFDFDGLILDTETPDYIALREVYQSMGQELRPETYGLVVGSQYNQDFEPVSHLQSLTGQTIEPAPFWERVDRRRMELIEKSQVLPGVRETIRAGREMGLRLAVASSSSHEWVDTHLKQHQLFDHFDIIRCREDVKNIKPEPDVFLAALDALGVGRREAVIFEDSANGVLAARRAGIDVILIPNEITRHLNITGENMRFTSMSDISLAELINKL